MLTLSKVVRIEAVRLCQAQYHENTITLTGKSRMIMMFTVENTEQR